MIAHYMDNCGNSRANTCYKPRLLEGVYLLDIQTNRGGKPSCPLVSHNNFANRMLRRRFKYLTYQLPTVGYWPTVAMTGNGELGFNSGEGARETATASKDGSRRANYPILTQGGSAKK